MHQTSLHDFLSTTETVPRASQHQHLVSFHVRADIQHVKLSRIGKNCELSTPGSNVN
jgi:hypothetical protein